MAAELDALVRAYEPVSARVNYLVTAETLRRHDAADQSRSDVVQQRFGAVQVEVGRMQRVLVSARDAVANVSLSGQPQRRVRQQLYAAIDVRRRALRDLTGLLAELRRGDGANTVRAEALELRWQQSWGASLAHARRATSTMQAARARSGVEPAPEEALR